MSNKPCESGCTYGSLIRVGFGSLFSPSLFSPKIFMGPRGHKKQGILDAGEEKGYRPAVAGEGEIVVCHRQSRYPNRPSRQTRFLLSNSLAVHLPRTCFFYGIFLSAHSYGPAKDVVCDNMGLTDEDVKNITGGTAQALFGSWTNGA